MISNDFLYLSDPDCYAVSFKVQIWNNFPHDLSNQVEDYFNIFAAFSECPNFIAKFSYEMIDKKCPKPPHFCFDIFIAVL